MSLSNRLHSNRGSALVISLVFAGTLAAVGAASLVVLQGKYRALHQAASWQEALLSAEAGMDLAMNEIRKELFDPENAWSGWNPVTSTSGGTETGIITPTSGPIQLTSTVLLRRGEGGTRSWSTVTVDAPDFLRDASGEQWFRIRSLGVAEVPGGRVAAGDKQDLRLRKLNLHTDRRTGSRVQSPQATRMIEGIARPVSAFRVALFGTSQVNMNNHNIVVDSYDSRDPKKSSNGFYDQSKRQKNGNIATNGTLIDAGNAQIYGHAATNGGTVLNAENVTGEIRSDFYQEVLSVRRPNVTPDAGSPTAIIGGTVLDAKPGDPSQIVVSSVQLSGSEILRIRGAADGSPTYCQITVTGDLSMSGQAELRLDPGVYVRIFVVGDADASGNGIVNPNSPLHLQLYGCDRPPNADGTPSSLGNIKITGNGGFRGCVYAPNYDITMTGGGETDSIYGAFVGNSVNMTGVQSVHYDEALADSGLISDYKIVSWFEDVR